MAPRILPDAEFLRQIFSYDPDTGEVRHRHRPDHHFLNPSRAKARNSRCAGKIATSTQGKTGYLTVQIGAKNYLAHRVIYKIVYDVEPPAVLDHINGNKKDNRIANLRAATKSTNGYNRHAPTSNKSGHKGVIFDRRYGTYYATCTVNKKQHYIGAFKTLSDAASAYEAYAKSAHGEFFRKSRQQHPA